MSRKTSQAKATASSFNAGFTAPKAFTKKIPVGETRVFDLLNLSLQGGPRFEDDTWHLDDLPGWPAGTRPSGKKFLFGDIPEVWRPLAKVTALVELDPAAAIIKFKLNSLAVHTYFPAGAQNRTVGAHIEFLADALPAVVNSGGTTFNGLSSSQWNKVATLLRYEVEVRRTGIVPAGAAPVLPSTSRRRGYPLVLLHQVAQLFGWDNPFGSPPFGNVPLKKVFPDTTRSPYNKVQPTDDAETAVAVASYFFESGIAQNIFDAAKWWFKPDSRDETSRYYTEAETQDENGKFSKEQKAKFAEFLRDFFDEHQKLPQNEKGQIAWARLYSLAGFDWVSRDPFLTSIRNLMRPDLEAKTGSDDVFYKWLRAQPKAQMNFSDVRPVEVLSFVPDADGERKMIRWCEQSDLELGDSLKQKIGWIVWMAVTLLHGHGGFRLKDRAMLDFDSCVEEWRDADGQTYWRLHAWKSKGKENRPEPIQFPISKTLFDALTLVKELHELLGIEAKPIERLKGVQSSARHLFAGDLILLNARPRETLTVGKQFVQEEVNMFIALLNERGIVEHDGLENVSPTQFRATTMQNYAASTAHGQAVAAAFGAWTSPSVERGYLGDARRRSHVALGKNASLLHVEDELDVQVGAYLVDLAQRDDLNEPGQRRVAEAMHGNPEIEQIIDTKLLTDKQVQAALKRIGENEASRFHVGLFGACAYSSSRALCDGDGWLNSQDCRPAACGNSITTRHHRAAIENERRIIERIVKDNPTSILADTLAVMNEDGEEIIAEFTGIGDDELIDIALEARHIGTVQVEITTKEDDS